MGLALLGAGCVMLLLPFIGKGDGVSGEDLTLSIFGSAAIAGGVLLLVTSALSQLAHEILLRLDDETEKKTEKGAGAENGS